MKKSWLDEGGKKKEKKNPGLSFCEKVWNIFFPAFNESESRSELKFHTTLTVELSDKVTGKILETVPSLRDAF